MYPYKAHLIITPCKMCNYNSEIVVVVVVLQAIVVNL